MAFLFAAAGQLYRPAELLDLVGVLVFAPAVARNQRRRGLAIAGLLSVEARAGGVKEVLADVRVDRAPVLGATR